MAQLRSALRSDAPARHPPDPLPAVSHRELGYNLVLYPVTAWRLAMKAVEDGLKSILEEGTQAHLIGRMQTRSRLYEILRYEDYNRFDESIHNFRLE